jgi:hypothetical protein
MEPAWLRAAIRGKERSMSSPKRHLTLVITASLILVGWLFAQVPAPVVQAGKTLPPRSTPTPDPDRGGHNDRDSDPAGAYIQLQVTNVPASAWAVVQWQDSGGHWHDVSGWRGQFGARGQVRWWVAPKDFGTGPFRWTVTRGAAGSRLGSSQAFDLPEQANVVLQIVVSLDAPGGG